MVRARTTTLLVAVLLTVAVLPIPAAASQAADGCTPGALCLAAGSACPDFALQIQYSGPRGGIYQEFMTEEGAAVHVLGAPAGAAITFTNMASGASVTFAPEAARALISLRPDDLRSEVVTGHTILILAAGQAPGEPSTMVYTGPVVFDVAMDGTFTIWTLSDPAINICAALTGQP